MTLASLDVSDTAALRKARGAFFTPEPVARYITDWAVRDVADRILEPSCGEASFLLAAVDRLAKLRAAGGGDDSGALDGVELHEASAAAARALLEEAGVRARIEIGDFFRREPTGGYDVVIGNPPFVRYQSFSGESRMRSREAALHAGVRLTNLASSWAAFTVHSALHLRAGGRLGLVLPAELLSVNYAAEIRRFLLASFANVEVVLFTERVFPDVQEEVVLLLAEGYRQGPTASIMVDEVRDASALTTPGTGRRWHPVRAEDKWTRALLGSGASTVYADLSTSSFTCLEVWGDTTLGMVTGNNRWFALSPARVAELRLAPSDLLPLSPPGSRHLRGLELDAATLRCLGGQNHSTLLFRPSGEPSRAARAYIASGEGSGVDTAYKCRVRTPWWRVPLVPPADLLLTYMNADTPRLVTNTAQAWHLNSVHGVYLRPDLRTVGRDLLPLASLTSMTLLGAETVGRSYGGGVLKLEPREADVLPVPSPELVTAAASRLKSMRAAIRELLRGGELDRAVGLVDEALLVGELGIPPADVASLQLARRELAGRRKARSGRCRR